MRHVSTLYGAGWVQRHPYLIAGGAVLVGVVAMVLLLGVLARMVSPSTATADAPATDPELIPTDPGRSEGTEG